MKKQTFTLIHRNGLGSRASTALVSEANKFQAEVCIRYLSECANLKSIMNVLALVIRHQERFTLEVEGPDEDVAFIALVSLLQSQGLIENSPL